MEFLSRSDERGIALALLLGATTVLAWLGVVRADAAMDMSHGPAAFSLGAMAAFTAEWGVMMTAMMLPSAVPMILLYRGASRRSVEAGERMIPAEAFALVVFVEKILPGGSRTARLVGVLLILVGITVAVRPELAVALRPGGMR